jgi:hypothetical protein
MDTNVKVKMFFLHGFLQRLVAVGQSIAIHRRSNPDRSTGRSPRRVRVQYEQLWGRPTTYNVRSVNHLVEATGWCQSS